MINMMNIQRKLEALDEAIKAELQVQYYGLNMEYWENIEDLRHKLNTNDYSYRLIVDGDILLEIEKS